MSLNEAFFEAIENGNLRKAKEYLSLGADITFNQGGFTPLGLAIQCSDMRLFNFLLKSGKLPKKEINSHISYALYNAEKDMAKQLIAHTDEVRQSSWSMDSLIKLAIDNKYPDILKAMLEKGLKPNKGADLYEPPLHYAARQKDPIYAKILGEVVPPDFYYGEELTPLMVAAEKGNDKTMDALLSLGANPLAEQKPRVSINCLVPSMLRAFFVVSTMTTIDSVIHKASYSGNPKTIDVLLKYQPTLDLNKFGTGLKTPLMIAAENGHTEMVHHLLKLGADVNHQCTYKSALHYAVDANSTEIAKLLLEYGIHQKSQRSGPSALEELLYQNRKYGIQNPELVDLLKYAQAHPQKVISQNPTYFPGRDPRGSRSRND